MQRNLENKVAVVVGAGTRGEGIGNGKAAAIQFAREGAAVFCIDKDPAAAQACADFIKEEGGIAEAFAADITSAKECEGAVNQCLKRFKKIDVLHNNVGIASMMEIVDTPEETWDGMFAVNVKGIFFMCKQAIPHMIEGGGGVITNVSSVAAVRSFPDAAYMSTKGTVNALTIYLAGRYGRYNIRTNALLLGFIDTPLARPAWDNEKVKKINLRQVPMRRFASPWEVATVAVFLASDGASYLNGVILPVDGGLSIAM